MYSSQKHFDQLKLLLNKLIINIISMISYNGSTFTLEFIHKRFTKILKF